MKHFDKTKVGIDIGAFGGKTTRLSDGKAIRYFYAPRLPRNNSMIQWLVDNHLEALQPKISALAQRLNDAMIGCYNDKMTEKTTI